MSERTYLAVNIEVEGKDFKVNEREIYNYSWGGASNYMFEDLISLFKNIKYYIFQTKYGEKKYHDLIFVELKRKIENFDILKNNIINSLKTSLSTKLSFDENENFSQMEINKYYDIATDAENGSILVDIKLKSKESYCKWCFVNYEDDKLHIAKKRENIRKYLYFDENKKEHFEKIMEIIDFISIVNTGNTDDYNFGKLDKEFQTVEYDSEFFEKELKKYYSVPIIIN